MQNETRIYTLGNGLRVVLRQTRSAVSYIGVAVGAGSRDEGDDRQGLAHFVEHTIFKGTRRRRSWHISNRMESIGGDLNAYTSKEETLIYTASPAGYAERAIELLGDIIANSTFPGAELEREREVVVEEINSYLDSPEDSVYDDFEELIYAGSPLAHNILGTPESVRTLDGSYCRRFLDDCYTPDNMVVYAADPGDPAKILRLIEKHFSGLHYPCRRRERTVPPVNTVFDEICDHGRHQAHTIMGVRTFGRRDPRRYALFLLNNYLGGPCMNSVLNQELRDRRGLVYTVESNVALLSDAGLLTIYFGCDRENTERCRRLVAQKLDSLAQTSLSERKFRAIQEQYCGQLTVTTDNRESMAMSMGKSVLYFGSVQNPETMAERVRAVTAEQVREVAELCCSTSRLTLR